MPRIHIIVPEGMNHPEASDGVLAPAHRACLDRVAQDAAPGDVVFVSPGNTFGHSMPEDRFAARELKAQRPDLDVHAIDTPRDRYLDTWDNAFRLRDWLHGQRAWPISECLLYSHRYHAWRSRVCFRAAGFKIAKTVTAVPRQLHGRRPRRLFYYDYPMAHIAYEALALLYTGFRALTSAGTAEAYSAAERRS